MAARTLLANKENFCNDNDGIDDQTDILNNVREYIKTKPKYKSKYYGTGYPDDEYGVCTDVVANGLKSYVNLECLEIRHSRLFFQ